MRVRRRSKRITVAGNMKKVQAAVCSRFGACAVAGCGNISKNAVWYSKFCGGYYKIMPLGDGGGAIHFYDFWSVEIFCS